MRDSLCWKQKLADLFIPCANWYSSIMTGINQMHTACIIDLHREFSSVLMPREFIAIYGVILQ